MVSQKFLSLLAVGMQQLCYLTYTIFFLYYYSEVCGGEPFPSHLVKAKRFQNRLANKLNLVSTGRAKFPSQLSQDVAIKKKKALFEN